MPPSDPEKSHHEGDHSTHGLVHDDGIQTPTEMPGCGLQFVPTEADEHGLLHSYRTEDFLVSRLDPVMRRNGNPHAGDHGWKELTLGVRLNGEPKAYVFEDLGERIAINDHLGGEDILVVWDRDSQLALPYWRQVDGRSLTFTLDPDVGFPFSLVDEETGRRWDILGVATEGPLADHRLVQIPAHNSFWFAWVTFWQETQVWQP